MYETRHDVNVLRVHQHAVNVCVHTAQAHCHLHHAAGVNTVHFTLNFYMVYSQFIGAYDEVEVTSVIL